MKTIVIDKDYLSKTIGKVVALLDNNQFKIQILGKQYNNVTILADKNEFIIKQIK